jgi:hypothetical protein
MADPIQLAKAGVRALALDRGAALNAKLVLKQKSSGVIDLTGLTFTSQVRKDTSEKSPLLATIAAEVGDDPTDGTITLTSDDVMALPEGTYKFDVWCDQWKRYILKGDLKIGGRVTHAA